MRALLREAALVGGLAIAMAAGGAHAQISGNVVKIGVLTDLSGVYKDLGGPGSVYAAQMAVDDAGGRVLGAPIEVVQGDPLNKPDVASGIVRKWFDAEDVDVVADVPTSGIALAVQEIVREKKRIFLMAGPASSDLSGKNCSPYGFQWVYNTYTLAHGTGGAAVRQGADTWFFITADYAFGKALERDTAKAVVDAGGKVLGSIAHPLGTQDFSSFLLQAQASKAKIIGLANAGGDTTSAIKQASEFGIVSSGQRLAGLLVLLNDVHSLGLQTAQGLTITDAWYWDMNDESRAFAKRYADKMGRPPNFVQAGVYSAVAHYIKAVKAAGTDDADKVQAKMREILVDDFMGHGKQVRADGRVARDFLLAQVKKPSESKSAWDLYKILAIIPAKDALEPLGDSACPLVKKN